MKTIQDTPALKVKAVSIELSEKTYIKASAAAKDSHQKLTEWVACLVDTALQP